MLAASLSGWHPNTHQISLKDSSLDTARGGNGVPENFSHWFGPIPAALNIHEAPLWRPVKLEVIQVYTGPPGWLTTKEVKPRLGLDLANLETDQKSEIDLRRWLKPNLCRFCWIDVFLVYLCMIPIDKIFWNISWVNFLIVHCVLWLLVDTSCQYSLIRFMFPYSFFLMFHTFP